MYINTALVDMNEHTTGKIQLPAITCIKNHQLETLDTHPCLIVMSCAVYCSVNSGHFINTYFIVTQTYMNEHTTGKIQFVHWVFKLMTALPDVDLKCRIISGSTCLQLVFLQLFSFSQTATCVTIMSRKHKKLFFLKTCIHVKWLMKSPCQLSGVSRLFTLVR